MAVFTIVDSDWRAVCREIDPVVVEALQDFCTPIRTARPPAEVELLKTGRSFHLSNGIFGVSWGRGPAVLLVHGWCGRSTQLGGFVKPLIEAGRSVVAIDCWGHGDSPGQESHGVAFAESIMLCNLEHGPFDAVIAHSLGAAATLISAGKGLELSRAVLLAPPELRTVITKFVQKKKLSDEAIRAFTPALESKVRVRAEEFLLKQAAQRVKIPVMIVHDAADREVPVADACEIARNLQHGVLVQVTGCGHRLLVKASEVINKAVGFVTGVTEPAVI